MAQSGQQQPDIPVVKGTTGKFAIFQRMRLKMSLLHLPSIAYLTVTENPRVFIESGLAPFEKCTVYIGDTLAATMYAVAVEPHVDKSGHQVSLALAAPTIDAVECSVDTDTLKTWAITEGTIGSVATQILKPYNIPVKSIQDVGINPVYPIPIQPGMTASREVENNRRDMALRAMREGSASRAPSGVI
jgi:prophage tail gpP-like protein